MAYQGEKRDVCIGGEERKTQGKKQFLLFKTLSWQLRAFELEVYEKVIF